MCADAKKESKTVAHRRGGGVFLGLRVPKGSSSKPQKHAWSLTGAPVNWDAQDVLKCLADAGIEDAEILKPPGKKKGWLFKGIANDASGIGVFAVQAGTHTMFVTRAQQKVERKVDKVVPIKGSGKGLNEPVAKRILLPDTPKRKRVTATSLKSVKDPLGETWSNPLLLNCPTQTSVTCWSVVAGVTAVTCALLRHWDSKGVKNGKTCSPCCPHVQRRSETISSNMFPVTSMLTPTSPSLILMPSPAPRSRKPALFPKPGMNGSKPCFVKVVGLMA